MPRQIELPIENEFMLAVMDKHGLTEIKHVAEFFGVQHSTAANWLHAKSIMPRADFALKIAQKLGISVGEVINGMMGIKVAS